MSSSSICVIIYREGDNGRIHLVISHLSSLSLDCSPIPRSKLLSVTQRRRTKIILRLGQAWISSMHCLSSFVESAHAGLHTHTHAMSWLLAPRKASLRERIVIISDGLVFSPIFIHWIRGQQVVFISRFWWHLLVRFAHDWRITRLRESWFTTFLVGRFVV